MDQHDHTRRSSLAIYFAHSRRSPMVSCLMPALIVAISLCWCIAPARATTLIFTTNPTVSVNGSLIPLDYGDNVTATTAVLSDTKTYNYLQGTGFTPNITADYQIWNALGNSGSHPLNPNLTFYDSSGDLPYAVYSTQSGTTVAEIDLIPAAGYSVTLNSFDLVGFNSTVQNNQPIRIYDAAYGLLTDFGGLQSISSSTHNHFAPAITSSGTLRIQYGNNFNLGINNVDFNQAVPEPSTITLFVLGAIGVWFAGRRRRVNG